MPPDPAATKAERVGLLWTVFLLLTLSMLTAVIYAPFINNPLVLEDLYYLHIYSAILYLPFWKVLFFHPLVIFRPVFWYLSSATYYFFGLNPVAYHLISLGLHLANAALLAILAFKLSRNRSHALTAAVLFHLSYLHSDAIFFTIAQVHLLGGLWFLPSLLAYIHHRQTNQYWFFLASLGLFYVAVFSNQSTIGLPVVCFLYDTIYRPSASPLRQSIVPSLLRLSTFVPAVAISLAISLQRGDVAIRYLLGSNLIKNAVTILSHPWYRFGPQGVIDLFRQSPSSLEFVKNLLEAPNAGTIIALILCAGATGVLFFWRIYRGTPLERFGSLFFLLTFLPFVPYQAVDRRYFYIPMMGLTLVVAHWLLLLWNYQTSPSPHGAKTKAALRTALIILMAVWMSYQISFTRQVGHDYRSAGYLVSRVIANLENSAPFGQEEHLFIKGLPKMLGFAYVFQPVFLEPLLRIELRNPTLRVEWIEPDGRFPPHFPEARFFIYKNQKLMEVTPRPEPGSRRGTGKHRSFSQRPKPLFSSC
jgi:hypothetical protein